MERAAREARLASPASPTSKYRPAQASVVDLQEDAAAREALRGDLRPPGHSRDRRIRAGLLPRAGRDPRRVDAGAGAHQGLHRAAQVERLPVAAHDGVRPGRQLYRRSRSARATCIAPPTSASRRTGGTRRPAKSDELDRQLAWFRQVLELQMDAKTPDEFLEFLKLDLYQDEIFVFTPTGDVIQLPRARRRSTSPSRCTRKSACTARAHASTAASRRSRASSRTRRRSRS